MTINRFDKKIILLKKKKIYLFINILFNKFLKKIKIINIISL